MDNLKQHKFRKRMNLLLGLIALVLAYIGTALPGVPGTPFILLTAFFFVRSSDRMYQWLMRNKLFAKIIHKFDEQEKLPLKFKLFVILQLWISIAVAEIWFIESLIVRIITALIGVIVSVLILLIKKFSLRQE
jgi:hypothetical protein